jgi:SAM-dependent methyltransferase
MSIVVGRTKQGKRGAAMPQTTARVRADFDRIAMLSERHGWNHNNHYHDFLLRHVPRGCGEVLDVGCGAGGFSRLLAGRCGCVLGLDLSPEMVRVAREQSRDYPNIKYEVADVMEWPFPPDRFDCIVSIATLHHLPLREMLVKMRDGLKAGGTLLVLDLYHARGFADTLTCMLAVPASLALRVVRGRGLREPPEVRQAWEEHGRYDTYPTLDEVRQACSEAIPGAKVRRHLFWRYSIVWTKGSE